MFAISFYVRDEFSGLNQLNWIDCKSYAKAYRRALLALSHGATEVCIESPEGDVIEII